MESLEKLLWVSKQIGESLRGPLYCNVQRGKYCYPPERDHVVIGRSTHEHPNFGVAKVYLARKWPWGKTRLEIVPYNPDEVQPEMAMLQAIVGQVEESIRSNPAL